jgi:DNA-binding transcriptional ArsR family regulator
MPNGKEAEPTKITIDVGTAYDFFQSLLVLHSPKKFAVRGAWASGMLARLTPESRETLSRAQCVTSCPVHLLPSLPAPKDVETLLWSLAQSNPTERLQRLVSPWYLPESGSLSVLAEVAERGRWTEADRRRLSDLLQKKGDAEKAPSEEMLSATLDIWADAEAFGDAYLAALRNYHDAFFHEEEKRIRPAIQAAAERISDRAKKLSLPDLIEEISAGIRYESPLNATELILAPSYWITPLMLRVRLDANRMLLVFGARAASDSIVPGETVPDGLIRTLKALSDPTRLRILRLVAEKSMGAAELARTLRLRTPTMLHHLHALRLSGLIQIRLPEADAKQKALFSLRPQAVRDVMSALDGFLYKTDSVDDTEAKRQAGIDRKDASEGG